MDRQKPFRLRVARGLHRGLNTGRQSAKRRKGAQATALGRDYMLSYHGFSNAKLMDDGLGYMLKMRQFRGIWLMATSAF